MREINSWNHLELCSLVFSGNISGAIRCNANRLASLELKTMISKRNYAQSLNYAIYNYILIKENISLHNCCKKNEDYLIKAGDQPLALITEQIILSYSNCRDYLIEKHPNCYIKECIKYIHDHLDEPLTLAIVSKQVNLNKCYLSALFKGHVKCSFCDYVLARRIALAKELLLQSDLSLSIIAQRCGFNSESYLCTCFKKVVGCSPCCFRKAS